MEINIKIKKVDNGFQYEFQYLDIKNQEEKKHCLVFLNSEHLTAAIKQHTSLYIPTQI